MSIACFNGSSACGVAAQARLLRRMLEWQRDLLGDPEAMEGEAGSSGDSGRNAPLPQSSQVQVLIVPTGKIEQVERGTTAGDIIRQKVRGSFHLLAVQGLLQL